MVVRMDDVFFGIAERALLAQYERRFNKEYPVDNKNRYGHVIPVEGDGGMVALAHPRDYSRAMGNITPVPYHSFVPEEMTREKAAMALEYLQEEGMLPLNGSIQPLDLGPFFRRRAHKTSRDIGLTPEDIGCMYGHLVELSRSNKSAWRAVEAITNTVEG